KIVAEFHQATGASVIPPKSAVATGSYRGLASVFGASTYTTVDGMIPADLSPEHDAQFARLAKDLKVDAVILMANSYTLNRDDGSIQTTAMDRYEVAIVGSDGKRLWHEKDMVETRPSEASAAGLGSSIVGMIPKEEAESLLREVTLKAVQNFSSHFSQKRGG
ncbi:MAG: hypothetical protein ACXVBW_15865, partial [Bdellovibrionota bacterium]